MEPAELIEAAMRALEQAYAPYSHYRVGAALLATDGRVFLGVNVENASYGLTICAERTAFAAAVASGARRFARLAVATESGAAAMCGACRQFAREFDAHLAVHLTQADGSFASTTLDALLPGSFGPEFITP